MSVKTRKSPIDIVFQSEKLLPFPIYSGTRRIEDMSWEAKQAYRSWYNQRDRCNRKKSKGYKWYGAKGIKVEYSSRAFIGWWLHQLAGKKSPRGKKSAMTCDRIDPNKNYCFSNIQLISRSQNSKRQSRESLFKAVTWHSPNGDINFRSLAEASKTSGVRVSHIIRYCKGIVKKKRFSYA